MNQKALCSLAAAAEALGDSIHRLLESTTYGSLRLYVKVPQDVLLFSIDEEQASPPRHTSTFSNPPFPPKLLDSKMTFLEISKKDRVNLFNNGFTQQTIFTFAIKVLPDSSISRERAPGSTSPSRYQSCLTKSMWEGWQGDLLHIRSATIANLKQAATGIWRMYLI